MSPTLLFEKYVQTPELDDERPIIQKAQNGCGESYETLLTKYAPLLKKYARSAPRTAETDEVQGALLLGFVEAVTDYQPEQHDTLAATLPNYLKRSLSGIGITASSFTIPQRSLSRWLMIMRKADGNTFKALEMAPSFSMTTETFLAIRSVLRDTNSLEAVLLGGEYVVRTLHIHSKDPVGESDHELTQLVFQHKGDENDLTDQEAQVLRHAYGYMTYGEPQTDDAVGANIGISRSSVQRIRTTALDKARRRLGINN